MRVIYNENTASLKDLMTAAPIDADIHAALLRTKVEARRLAEDAREDAKQRRLDSLETQA